MNIKIYPLIRGLLSYILPRYIFEMPGSGGTYSAEYCYSVWLRHLTQLKKSNLIKDIRDLNSIAEIGPGDSLGIGIAGLFCGINEYFGFDVIKHANKESNIKIANELYKLFLERRIFLMEMNITISIPKSKIMNSLKIY
jgi:hypothetical protein